MGDRLHPHLPTSDRFHNNAYAYNAKALCNQRTERVIIQNQGGNKQAPAHRGRRQTMQSMDLQDLVLQPTCVAHNPENDLEARARVHAQLARCCSPGYFIRRNAETDASTCHQCFAHQDVCSYDLLMNALRCKPLRIMHQERMLHLQTH